MQCPATAAVLGNRYDYPDNMNEYTKYLLEGVHRIFSGIIEDQIADFVGTQGFQ